jgi:hypothetical protein
MAHPVPIKPTRKPPQADSAFDHGARELTELSALEVAALRAKWQVLFGSKPSSCLGRQFMVRAIAYRLQESGLGDLKPSTRRLLDRVGDGRGETALDHSAEPRPGAGTVLIRQWRGVAHRVAVLDDEVVYQGRRYKSLSEVARLITGTRWSGPLFFGLKRRVEEAANG